MAQTAVTAGARKCQTCLFLLKDGIPATGIAIDYSYAKWWRDGKLNFPVFLFVGVRIGYFYLAPTFFALLHIYWFWFK